MKLLTGLVFCSLVLGVSSQRWFSFLGEAYDGARDMWRAYSDMKEANYKIQTNTSINAREGIQKLLGHGAEDTLADQAANEWGRSGKDPNHFRPAGLPEKY
uniref:Serum amyloid A protein n=1 Tax=Rhinopithecus bieti TaxID=61621 RepID=A0A2K6MIY0_RHIBE